MKTKAILLTIICFSLTSCEEDKYCRARRDPQVYESVFLACLDRVAAARQGRDYTTNDDEDFEYTVEECRIAAGHISQRWDHCKKGEIQL